MADHDDMGSDLEADAEEIHEVAFVYKMTNTHPEVKNMVYVGSTPRDLASRKIQHRSAARLGVQKYKFYRAMHKYGIDMFDIEEIEVLHNITAAKLHDREEYWISKLDSIANGFNDKHGNGQCIIHDCDRRRCPCGGSHCCGCIRQGPCKSCKGDVEEVKQCGICDGTGTRTVYVRREQCGTHGGNQMCPKHPERAKAYCTALECRDTATGLCEPHGVRLHDCSTCRACTVCPNDENRAPANPKHIDGKKHAYNVRLRKIILERAGPDLAKSTVERQEFYVNFVINYAEQALLAGKPCDPLYRLSDHRRLNAYQTRLDTWLVAHPSQHAPSISA